MNREKPPHPTQRRDSKFSWKKVLASLGVFALIAVITVGGVLGYSMYQAGKVNHPQATASTKTPLKRLPPLLLKKRCK